MAAKNKKNIPFTFQVSDSITVLLITCVVAAFFAVLLCFYPGQAFLKDMFWPLVALPALLSLGTGYKLLTRKPILQIDSKGILFFRSGITVSWEQVQSAQLVVVGEGDDAEDYLLVKYINAQRTAILETDFHITGAMNKTPAEVMAAIEFFKK